MAIKRVCQYWGIFKLGYMTLLQIAEKDSLMIGNLIAKSITNSNNIWLYVALFELLIIFLLIVYIVYQKSRAKDTKFENEILDAKDNDINMNDLMLSINKSRELYRELSRNCHPDKHISSEFQNEIGELFQEITRSKRNYQELLRLKDIAVNKYKIKLS